MIQIIVRRGLGDKEAPTIEDDRVVHEQMAIRRGANFLNEQWYHRTARTLRVPHSAGINDDKIASIVEGNIPIDGKQYISSVRIVGTPKGLDDELTVEEFQEFF